jgi:hypothetical protein
MSDELDDGRYRARGVSADYGVAGTGTEQVAVLFELEGGYRRTWYGYLSDNAVERTLKALKACGVTNLETLEGIDANEVEVVLKTEEYNGNWNQKIAFVNELGSGAIAMKTRMAPEQKRSFAERMKGKWIELGGTSAPASSIPVAKADDDIPF